MRNKFHWLSWSPRSLAFLLGLGCFSGLALRPSMALAQASTEKSFLDQLGSGMGELSKVGGYISAVKSAYDLTGTIGVWIGALNKPISMDDLYAEALRIAGYQDWQFKKEMLIEIEAFRQEAAGPMSNRSSEIANHTFDPTSSATDLWEQGSRNAVNRVLAPTLGGNCTENVAIFQDLAVSSSHLMDYDWRIGMNEAILTVATRLAMIALKFPNYRTNQSFVGSGGELDQIRTCLKAHRDRIQFGCGSFWRHRSG